MNTFGERLKALRTEKGYSQNQVARYIDVNPGLVSQWEAGKCVLRDNEKGKQLAYFLGTTFDFLMFGKFVNPTSLTTSEKHYTKDECRKADPIVYKAEDGRKLDDINLIIRHIRDMHITDDEKRRIHNRLSQMRTEVESIVLFGE